MEKEVINYFILLEPVSDTLRSALAAAGKQAGQSNLQVVYAKSPEEATQLIRQYVPCIAGISVQKMEEVPGTIGFLKGVSDKIDSKELRVIAVNKVNSPKLTKALEQMKLSVVVTEPVSERTLMFKLLLQIKALDVVRKQIENKKRQSEVIAFTSDKNEDAQNKGTEPMRFAGRKRPAEKEKFVLNKNEATAKDPTLNAKASAAEGGGAWQRLRTDKLGGKELSLALGPEAAAAASAELVELTEEESVADTGGEEVVPGAPGKSRVKKKLGSTLAGEAEADAVTGEVTGAPEAGAEGVAAGAVPARARKEKAARGLPGAGEKNAEEKAGTKNAEAAAAAVAKEKLKREREAIAAIVEKAKAEGRPLSVVEKIRLAAARRAVDEAEAEAAITGSATEAAEEAAEERAQTGRAEGATEAATEERELIGRSGAEQVALEARERADKEEKRKEAQKQKRAEILEKTRKEKLSQFDLTEGGVALAEGEDGENAGSAEAERERAAAAKGEWHEEDTQKRDLRGTEAGEDPADAPGQKGKRPKKTKISIEDLQGRLEKNALKEGAAEGETGAVALAAEAEEAEGAGELGEGAAEGKKKRRRGEESAEAAAEAEKAAAENTKAKGEKESNFDLSGGDGREHTRSESERTGGGSEAPAHRAHDNFEESLVDWDAQNAEAKAAAKGKAGREKVRKKKADFAPGRGVWLPVGNLHLFLTKEVELGTLESISDALPLYLFHGTEKPQSDGDDWVFDGPFTDVVSREAQIPDGVRRFLAKFLKSLEAQAQENKKAAHSREVASSLKAIDFLKKRKRTPTAEESPTPEVEARAADIDLKFSAPEEEKSAKHQAADLEDIFRRLDKGTTLEETPPEAAAGTRDGKEKEAVAEETAPAKEKSIREEAAEEPLARKEKEPRTAAVEEEAGTAREKRADTPSELDDEPGKKRKKPEASFQDRMQELLRRVNAGFGQGAGEEEADAKEKPKLVTEEIPGKVTRAPMQREETAATEPAAAPSAAPRAEPAPAKDFTSLAAALSPQPARLEQLAQAANVEAEAASSVESLLARFFDSPLSAEGVSAPAAGPGPDRELSRAERIARELGAVKTEPRTRTRSRGEEIALKMAMAGSLREEGKLIQAMKIMAEKLNRDRPEIYVAVVALRAGGAIEAVSGPVPFGSLPELERARNFCWTTLGAPPAHGRRLGLLAIHRKGGAPLAPESVSALEQAAAAGREFLSAA